MSEIDSRRVRILKDASFGPGPIVYWMSRDQRATANWALLYAQQLAISRRVPLVFLFCIVPKYLGATQTHYGFMLQGLQEVEQNLLQKGIPFHLVHGNPGAAIPRFLKQRSCAALVCDFSPLRTNRKWKNEVVQKTELP